MAERSKGKIQKSDLRRLLIIAKGDLSVFFNKNPNYQLYKGKEKLVTFAQGGAKHFLDGVNGIKDFDVWFFFPLLGIHELPYRRRGKADFGESEFGVHPEDVKAGFKGRRVDVLMRSLHDFNSGNPIDCLESYLQSGRNKTTMLLRKKPMIGLWPEKYFGKVIWTPKE